jgi:FkbH-like protein
MISEESALTPKLSQQRRTVAEYLERALGEAKDPGVALRALAQISPPQTIELLLRDGTSLRASLGAPALRELVRQTLLTGLATGGSAFASQAMRLLRACGDLVTAELVIAVALRLAPDERLNLSAPLVSEALVREPRNPKLLRLASDLGIHQNDPEQAHRLLTRLGRADPSWATVQYVQRARAKLPMPGGRSVRAALLSSFTVDPLVAYLDLECRELGLVPEIYLAPFNSWAQELIGDGSALRHFDPEIVFLAVSIDDLVPGLVGSLTAQKLQEGGDLALERVLTLARQFSDWSGATLVVHGFYSAHRDPAGILEGRSGPSRNAWLADLNARLGAELRQLPRAYVLDMSEVIMRRATGALEEPKLRHLAAMRLGEGVLPEVARAYACYVAPLKGLTAKCVVVDLDNTLWGGVIGEDGVNGIKLGDTAPGSEYREFQQYLQTLRERGILLAISSKNNPADALEVIRSHPAMLLREDAFSAMRINWSSKPENMLSLAAELNIGVDSLVFLDDNPHERELMRQALPQVLTPDLPADPSLYRRMLETLPQLQILEVTPEDRARAALYQAKRQRAEVRLAATSLIDYLNSLEIRVQIAPAGAGTLPRVHQLFQRTNQFNLTTRRYEAAQLAHFVAEPQWRLYAARAQDRFGDHGLVAVALVEAAGEIWRIDSFLMSCRVIGYGVETALLSALSREAAMAGATSLLGEFITSAKNQPAADFYPRHGFTPLSRRAEAEVWELELKGDCLPPPDWVHLNIAHEA